MEANGLKGEEQGNCISVLSGEVGWEEVERGEERRESRHAGNGGNVHLWLLAQQ